MFLAQNTSLTVEARFRLKTLRDGTLIQKGNAFRLEVTADGRLRASFLLVLPGIGSWPAAATIESLPGTVRENVDHHAAAVQGAADGSAGLRLALYLDGEEIASSIPEPKGFYRLVNNTQPLRIGSGVHGAVRDVRLWNVAREAFPLWKDHKRVLSGTEEGLIGYWKMDEEAGTTILDSTANGNHGTVLGGASWETVESRRRSLWACSIDEDSPQIVIHQSSGWIERRTKPNTDEISADIIFPGGLYQSNKYSEGTSAQNVAVELEYRPAGSEEWTRIRLWSVTANTKKPLRLSHRWPVPRGQYDVRLRRTTEDRYEQQSRVIVDLVYWTALRSIRHEIPVRKAGLCTICPADQGLGATHRRFGYFQLRRRIDPARLGWAGVD